MRRALCCRSLFVECVLTQLVDVSKDEQGLHFVEQLSARSGLNTAVIGILALIGALSVFLTLGANDGATAPMPVGSDLFALLSSALPQSVHVGLNLVMFAWVVFVLVRTADATLRTDVSPVFATVVLIAVASLGSLPFYVAFESADIFAPVLVIILATLAVFADRLGRWELVSLVLIGAFGTVLHPSLVAIVWLSVPLVWIVSFSIKNMRPIRALASTLIIAIVGAMGMILAPSEGSGFTTEDLGVVLGMVGSDPVLTLSGLMKATLDQANRYQIDGAVAETLRTQGWVGLVTTFHSMLYAVAALLAVVLTVLPQKAPPLRMRGCVGMLLGGVLINALVCGLLPDASSQHGARVAFLLPMGLALLMLFYTADPKDEQG